MGLNLKKRGLLLQSYGVQNAGAPGDLEAIDFGSATRRAGGPSLTGWPFINTFGQNFTGAGGGVLWINGAREES